MILTITLNPCIDKSSRTEILKPDNKLRCTEVVHEAGGGGINVSKALHKLAVLSVAMFPAGGHNGDMLQSLLEASDIPYHKVDTKVETRENWIVVEENTNQQFRFTFPGRHVEESTVEKLIEDLLAYTPEFIVASGSLPLGLPSYFYGLLVKTANALGAKCIVDTSGEALRALQGRNAYLIKPNIGELSNLVGVQRIELEDVPEAAKQVIQNRYAQIVVVSMGADGAWIVSKDEQHYVPAPKVTKKSTVGAGDSMVAGITHMLQKHADLKDALCMGVACGSAATMNEGTKLFTTEQAYALYQTIRESVN